MPGIKLSEHAEQANFFAEVRWRYRNDPDFIPDLLFSVPNGFWAGGSSPRGKFALINKYKSEGMHPGAADIVFLEPRGKYAYLAIEMKSANRGNEKNGGATEEQLKFLEAVNRAGGLGVIAYGAEHAMQIFSDYMALRGRDNNDRCGIHGLREEGSQLGSSGETVGVG